MPHSIQFILKNAKRFYCQLSFLPQKYWYLHQDIFLELGNPLFFPLKLFHLQNPYRYAQKKFGIEYFVHISWTLFVRYCSKVTSLGLVLMFLTITSRITWNFYCTLVPLRCLVWTLDFLFSVLLLLIARVSIPASFQDSRNI